MVNEIEWDLLEKRLEAMPEDLVTCCIGLGDFTKEDIMRHVKAKDNIGEIFLERSIYYMRKLKTGLIK